MNDLISRQAAIDVLRNRWLKTRNYDGIGEDIAEECEIYLKTLPSAQPVRHGKWKKIKGAINCSACKNCSWSTSFEGLVSSFNYCPNCGAKMDAEQEEQNGV